MRLMNWNIEHMNTWWESGDQDPAVMLQSFPGSAIAPAITDVPALAERAGNVINSVDPDVITIQEGAGTPEMEDFFDRLVNADWEILRGSGGAQALVVAARLDRDVSAMAEGPVVAGTIDLGQPFNADVDADAEVTPQNFARKPQVTEITAHGQDILILNNHLKSKFVDDAEGRFNAGGDQRLAFFRDALVVRRRISAEAFRIRAYLDELFTADPMALAIVTGDLNDGPGSDFFEENFLTHSVVDRIFGSIFRTDRQLTHVLLHGASTDFTAQFFDFITGEVRDLVLDHVGLSSAINMNWDWEGRVAVAEYDAQIDNSFGLNERDRLPSDHRPVVVNMTP